MKRLPLLRFRVNQLPINPHKQKHEVARSSLLILYMSNVFPITKQRFICLYIQ